MNRKDIYDTIHSLKDTVDLYPLFLSLDIPKTVNKNGVTLNLSAISEKDIETIHTQLKNITVQPKTIDDREISTPIKTLDPVKPKSVQKYLKMNLTPIQKFIINSVN